MADRTRAAWALAPAAADPGVTPRGDASPARSTRDGQFPGWVGRLAPHGAAFLTILVGWQIASALLPAYLIPAPAQVFLRLRRELASQKFLVTIARSFVRLGIGYGMAGVLGVVVGLATGIWGLFRRYARAMLSILQSIPPIAWVPLFIILLGFGDRPIILVIIISAFFPMAVGVMNAVEHVERVRLDVARLMGASRLQLVKKVYAPEVLPAIVTGAQVAFGNAWRSLIAAEMVGGVNVGLGWSITIAGEIADMTGVLVGIVVIGLLSAALDSWVLEHLKRRLLKWKYAP